MMKRWPHLFLCCVAAFATAGEPILTTQFSALGMSAQRLLVIHGQPSPKLAAAVDAEGWTVLAFDKGAYTAIFRLNRNAVQRASFSAKRGEFTPDHMRGAQLVNGINPGVKPQPGQPSATVDKHTMVFYCAGYEAAARSRNAELSARAAPPSLAQLDKLLKEQARVALIKRAVAGWSLMEGEVIQRTASGFLFAAKGQTQVVHMVGPTACVDGDKLKLWAKFRGEYQYTKVSGALATVREYEWEEAK